MIENAKLTTALKSLAMCCPAVVVPLTGMDVRIQPSQDALLVVDSTGFTLGSGFADLRLSERAHVVARGTFHVMLGHAAALRDAIRGGADGIEADRALQDVVAAMIRDNRRLPSGMFTTGATDEIGMVVAPAGKGDRGHAAIVDLMLDARSEDGDIVAVALDTLGLAREGERRIDAMGWILRDEARTVVTIEQGQSLLARLDTLRLASVARTVALSSVLETILRSLKAIGVKASAINRAFKAQCEAACADIFADGPLIRLG